eukprot:g754.t1
MATFEARLARHLSRLRHAETQRSAAEAAALQAQEEGVARCERIEAEAEKQLREEQERSEELKATVVQQREIIDRLRPRADAHDAAWEAAANAERALEIASARAATELEEVRAVAKAEADRALATERERSKAAQDQHARLQGLLAEAHEAVRLEKASARRIEAQSAVKLRRMRRSAQATQDEQWGRQREHAARAVAEAEAARREAEAARRQAEAETQRLRRVVGEGDHQGSSQEEDLHNASSPAARGGTAHGQQADSSRERHGSDRGRGRAVCRGSRGGGLATPGSAGRGLRGLLREAREENSTLRAALEEVKEKARTDLALVAADLEQAQRDAAAYAQRFTESEASTAEWRLRASRAERAAAQLERVTASIDAAVREGEQRLGIGVRARQNPGSASSAGSAGDGAGRSTRRPRSMRVRSSEPSRPSTHDRARAQQGTMPASSAPLRMASRSSPRSKASRLRYRAQNQVSENEDTDDEEQDSEEKDGVATVTKRLRYTPETAQARTGKRRRLASASVGTSDAHSEIRDSESEDDRDDSTSPDSPHSSDVGGKSTCITM